LGADSAQQIPFHDPEQLVVLHADLRGLGAQSVGFSVPEFDDLRDRAGVFSAHELEDLQASIATMEEKVAAGKRWIRIEARPIVSAPFIRMKQPAR
jgi:hypothetical protein